MQRSFKEFPLLDGLIQEGKLELHFNTEGMVIARESKSQDRLMWSIGVVMSQAYVDNLRDNVKRGMEQKARSGEWGFQTPIGYESKPREGGRNWLYPDPTSAPIITEVFKRYSTGLYSLAEMVEYAEAAGLRSRNGRTLNRTWLHKLLNNTFYAGEMVFRGQLMPHRYECLIDMATFTACQRAMKAKSSRQGAIVYKGKDFLFRGVLQCAMSGRTVSPDIKREKYVYLICQDPENPKRKMWVPEGEVVSQVEDVLQRLSIPDDVLQAMKERVSQAHDAEKAFHGDSIKKLEQEKRLLQVRSDKLLDLYLDGGIDQEGYNKKLADMRMRKTRIMADIDRHESADDKFKDSALQIFELASSAAFTFKHSNIEQKREMLGLLFSNMKLNGKKLEYSMHQPFDMMLDIQTVTAGGARGIRTPNQGVMSALL